MPNFHYVALDSNGQENVGVIEAATQTEASDQLRRTGFFPTQLVEEGKEEDGGLKKRRRDATKSKGKVKTATGKAGGKIKTKSLMIFTRQLATLIQSGLPLLRSLTVLGKGEPNPVLKRTVNSLADSVQSGSTFSESLAQFPKIFNKLYVNMVKAGELGGVLEVVLTRLAEYQEKAQKLKNKIVAAMVYPVIVMFIATGILVFLMLVIVPRFEKIFVDMLGSADKLPGITKFVMGFSGWMQSNVFYLAGIVVVFFITWKFAASTVKGRKMIDQLKLMLPVFGDIQRKSAIARFTRTLGTLVSSGVPILQALNITRETAGNAVVADAIMNIHNAVKEGESIVAPMEASDVFPPMVVSMVDVGEETGQLPEMLLKIANVYDDEVDNAVTAMTSMLEPVMIVVLAVIVGTIVMALFMPLITIIQELS